jgi:hypothetical protein
MTNFENWDNVAEKDLGGHVHLTVEKEKYKTLEEAKGYIRQFCLHFKYATFRLDSQTKERWNFFIFDKK